MFMDGYTTGLELILAVHLVTLISLFFTMVTVTQTATLERIVLGCVVQLQNNDFWHLL